MDPTSLRAATGNAASGRDEHGRTDHARWARGATDLGVDVWGVQEVDRLLPRSGGADQAAALVEALGPGWTGRFGAAVHGAPGGREAVRPARPGDPVQPSYGVALATRLPVTAWHELHLHPSPAGMPVPLPPGASQRVAWIPDEPRVALAAEVVVGGRAVTVVTTHLSFVPTRAVTQLRTVVRWADALPGPTVLLGDLNLPRPVAAWASGLTSAAAGATYPSVAPRVQLDHVLVPRPLRLDQVAVAQVGGSDHLAVTATVRLA